MNNKAKNEVEVLTVEQAKDRFLIQKDDFYIVPDGVYVFKDAKLNSNLTEINFPKFIGSYANPWGLDGLSIFIMYDPDLKSWSYHIYPRFRICDRFVADYSFTIAGPKPYIDYRNIKTDTYEEFIDIVQEAIDKSSIHLYSELNRYDIIFMDKRYSVSANVNENGHYININAYDIKDNVPTKNITIRPIGLSKLVYRTLDCAIIVNGKENVYNSFVLYEG